MVKLKAPASNVIRIVRNCIVRRANVCNFPNLQENVVFECEVDQDVDLHSEFPFMFKSIELTSHLIRIQTSTERALRYSSQRSRFPCAPTLYIGEIIICNNCYDISIIISHTTSIYVYVYTTEICFASGQLVHICVVWIRTTVSSHHQTC